MLTGAPGILPSGGVWAGDSPFNNECTWAVKFNKLGPGDGVSGAGVTSMF